jgi:hypothetical protein
MFQDFDEFYSKEFPFNMKAHNMKPPAGKWKHQTYFPSNPWDMLMQPPFKNFEQMMEPFHQFHHQQQAFLNSGPKPQNFNFPQSIDKTQNPNYQKPPDFTTIFNNIEGVIQKANKYYPYVKKAGSFLNNFNKML